MATFKVGQRVKLIAKNNPKCAIPIGATGVVESTDFTFPGLLGLVQAYPFIKVRMDKLYTDSDGKSSDQLFSVPEHLAPLEPPKATTWEACGFHPNDFLKENV